MTPVLGIDERARRGLPRRAFSLLELVAVVFLLGVIAAAGMMRFGHAALNKTDTEGFVRRLALDLRVARRATIATGDKHYVRLNRVAGAVTGYDLYREDAGGDYTVQPTTPLPDDTTVTSTSLDDWRFNFSGALDVGGATSSLRVDGTDFFWTVDVYQATGAVRTSVAPQL